MNSVFTALQSICFGLLMVFCQSAKIEIEMLFYSLHKNQTTIETLKDWIKCTCKFDIDKVRKAHT